MSWWAELMSDDSRYEVKALIGVVMAITGNFLISLALNVQKYAHNQIKRQAIEFTEYSAPASVSEPTRLAPQSSSSSSSSTTARSNGETGPLGKGRSETTPSGSGGTQTSRSHRPPPLVLPNQPVSGSDEDSGDEYEEDGRGHPLTAASPLLPRQLRDSHFPTRTPGSGSTPRRASERAASTDYSPYYPPSPAPGHSHVTIPTSPEALGSSGHNSLSATDSTARHDENAYLKSRSWWLGMVLMVSGEVGNFMAYGFAPASVVAPLGTVTLITNVFLAPLVLKETVRTRDAIGVVLAILGAMVVVSSSKSTEVSLTPESLWAAITSFTAGLYYLLTVTTMVILAVLSPVWGPRLVLIDIGLVALSGGYTVLATKGVSSLLQLELILMFKHPITYLLLAVLLYSAVVQIRYLNRALQYFDSTVVIPTQFVLFTLSAIIGSAVIYRDFEDVSLRAGFFFVLGCLLTFLGVFLITSNRPSVPVGPIPKTTHDDPELGVSARDIGADNYSPPAGAENWSPLPSQRQSHRRSSSLTSPGPVVDQVSHPPTHQPYTHPRHHHLRHSYSVAPTSGEQSSDPLWSYFENHTSPLQPELLARRRSIADSISESLGAPGLPQAIRHRYTEMTNRIRSNSRSIMGHASQLHGVLNPIYMAVANDTPRPSVSSPPFPPPTSPGLPPSATSARPSTHSRALDGRPDDSRMLDSPHSERDYHTFSGELPVSAPSPAQSNHPHPFIDQPWGSRPSFSTKQANEGQSTGPGSGGALRAWSIFDPIRAHRAPEGAFNHSSPTDTTNGGFRPRHVSLATLVTGPRSDPGNSSDDSQSELSPTSPGLPDTRR